MPMWVGSVCACVCTFNFILPPAFTLSLLCSLFIWVQCQEVNHKPVDIAHKGSEVCVKIGSSQLVVMHQNYLVAILTMMIYL